MDDVKLVELLDWLEGRLPASEMARVSALASEGDVTALLSWVEKFQLASRNVVLEKPPTSVRKRLREQFASTRPGLIQQLIAKLTFDSWAELAPAGVRSASTQGQQRQLVYSTELADIAVNIHPSGAQKQFDLLGQVLPLQTDEAIHYDIQLWENQTDVRSTATDELGEFTFEALSPGTYKLVLNHSRVQVIISPIPLKDIDANQVVFH